jgi:hypothetical protein
MKRKRLPKTVDPAPAPVEIAVEAADEMPVEPALVASAPTVSRTGQLPNDELLRRHLAQREAHRRPKSAERN